MSEVATAPQNGKPPNPHAGNWLDTIPVLSNLVRVYERRDTIRFLVSSNLRAGHRDKVLGNLWNLLDPAFFMAIYFVVFGLGLRQAGDKPWEFVVYLSIGVLAFHFMSGLVSQAAVCIPSHRAIIHEVPFPKAVLPIALCFSRLYDYLWALAVLLGVMFLVDADFSHHIAWLPVIIFLQLVFGLGVALIVAYVGAFYADTANIVAIGMQMTFFASPIFYFSRSEFGYTGIVPPKYLDLYMLNPMACFMEAYRDAVLWGRMPDPSTLLYLTGISIGILVIGFALFARGENKFAKYL